MEVGDEHGREGGMEVGGVVREGGMEVGGLAWEGGMEG